ncbi:MAG: nucleotidyltransferase domain-containing protein [Magnetococcus sp. YQC-5]
MNTGLSVATLDKICSVFARFPQLEKVVLYGSRAKGTFKSGSDIDLTLYGPALSPDTLARIDTELDDLLLPYTMDLSLFDTLDHVELREHIDRVGVVLYQSGEGLQRSSPIKN